MKKLSLIFLLFLSVAFSQLRVGLDVSRTTDISVKWHGKNYPRKSGKIFYNMKWYEEGRPKLPWEAKAIKAEKK